MLTRRGVTAWRQALASLAPAGRPAPGTSTAAPARQPGMHPAQAADLPAPVAAELINVLAALVLAGAATTSPSRNRLFPLKETRCSPIPRRRR